MDVEFGIYSIDELIYSFFGMYNSPLPDLTSETAMNTILKK